jgi:hypothetical protein
MARGRPPKGLGHIDSLSGNAEEKERLKAILATLAGDLTVKAACERLGVSESRFHEIRCSALEGMLHALAPRPPGRPAKERKPEEVEHLEARVSWLEEELQVARLQTEVALWKPSLLRDSGKSPQKKRLSARAKGRRLKCDGRSDT